jgi:hypothetical protein
MEIGLRVCFDDFLVKFEYGSPVVKNKVTPPKYGKNLLNTSGHIFAPIIIKTCQNACLGNCLDDFEHWLFRMKYLRSQKQK